MKVTFFKIATNNQTGEMGACHIELAGVNLGQVVNSRCGRGCPCHQWGEIVASFYCQLAAWFPDMFCNFYVVKNYKIAENSTPIKARENISTESLEF